MPSFTRTHTQVFTSGLVVILTHSPQKRMNKLSVGFSSWSFNAFTVCITQTCPHTVTVYTEALGCQSLSASYKLMESCFKNAKQKNFCSSDKALSLKVSRSS